MKRLAVVCGIAALWCGGPTRAVADSDAGVWLKAGISTDLMPRLELQVDQHVRFDEAGSRLSAVMPEAGLELAVTDFFDLGVGYRYEYERDGMDLEGGHRVHVEGSLSADVGALRAGYRLRVQDRVDDSGKERLRNRVQLELLAPGVRPGVAVEAFQSLEDSSLAMRKWRFTLGAKFEAWDQDAEVFYRIDVPWDPMDTVLHIVGLEVQAEL